MKKSKVIIYIVIFSILGLMVGNINAFYIDENLLNVWKRRIDLQKVFPDKVGLIEWAEKYGWKEDDSLIKYSPYGEMVDNSENDFDNIINEIKNQNFELLEKVERLQKDVKVLENNNINIDSGQWLKCCGYGGGDIKCDTFTQEHRCSGNYEFYIYADRFIDWYIY